MVVHLSMEFKFCFSYVLLLTFTAVNEVTYIIGFTCDRLLDVVCFRVMVTENPKGLKIHRSSKHKKQSNKPTTPGFWPCKSDPRCAICKEGHFSTSIISHHNSKTHNIKQSVTCKSNNVCYLIDCNKCKQQYVGETELEFHCQMNNHKSDI